MWCRGWYTKVEINCFTLIFLIGIIYSTSVLRTLRWTQSSATSDAVKQYKCYNQVHKTVTDKSTWNHHTAQTADTKELQAIEKQMEKKVYTFVFSYFFFHLRVKWGGTGSRKWRKVRGFPTQTTMNALVGFHFKLNSACRKTISWPSMQSLKNKTPMKN